ncbi:DUF4864 domain-containing protein [Phaeobacter italicus]|jgi:hypothetical protein|uniref:DUF4864 domain-containing protein n=1 Tax=Phaeobacter italicus TaxID=481446 RepID=UPI0001870390|nr:DUF4864 domain-containing protein [Phaeobacter italicus]EEB72706.1 conserved hypothetical protein [Ruegeria sp. R11]MEC8016828.1 DUF4864 domain-containing protein [Pseudomonadota bacterium]MBY5976439.1 DUF4864 domain-containing protein [Phaeobacter italicus]MCI5099428.1 DUF4864 domain-containing protein [Phaeobacter italicus]CRL13005.1 hypothetical protein NIT7645_00013 [Phaeobacter italicus]
MRKLMLTSICVAVLAFPAVGRSQETSGQGAITGVIASQIDAFLRQDVDAAFEFASPNIRGLFGSSERFGAMVQSGYPMVWQPQEVRYLALRNVAGRLWQRVMITDAEGRVHLLDYQMVETGKGWKINAVQLLTGDAEAA